MAYGKTIAAISTPSGKGGVAIIRISGDMAQDIIRKIFFPKGKKSPTDAPRMAIYGDIRYGDDYIDDGIAIYYKAPFSYTGEDIIEISCHGGTLVTKRVLEAAFMAGATPAGPGEFTERAFINGRLSLTEAEAISDLLEAKSYEQIKLSSLPMREKLKDAVADIRYELVSLLSSVFARIDYPDEDLGDFTDEQTEEKLITVKDRITSLLRTYPTGKAIRDGVYTVIAGKCNVGKSTVYNAILGEDAAIVTDIEGTTRDVLYSTVATGKVLLRLADTAGVRSEERADTVEKIGIERSLKAIGEAELVIAVFDGSRTLDADDERLIEIMKDCGATKIALINKSDLEIKLDENKISCVFDKVLKTSAKLNATETASVISGAVDSLFTDDAITTADTAIVSSARHNASLSRALEYVEAAISAIRSGVYADASASEIERALGAISEVDGREVSEAVITDIFSKFCVGK